MFLCWWSSVFPHPSHLHYELHATPALKHSQYFFWHCDFLQLQLFFYATFLHRFFRMLLALSTSWLFSVTLEQLQHAHYSVHILPDEKHSQYNFRQPVFLQTHPVFFFFFGVLILSLVPTNIYFSGSLRWSCWYC